ncbi:MAG: lasso peptide biosynthesis protein, partial [Gemmatimonadota bacterium]
MSRLHAIAIGVRTAWRVPAWIAEAEAADLLATEWPREWSDDLPRSEIEAASSAAWLTLRLLARLHPGRWKTSCLYRSAAECQLLRELGVPASVRLGVHREGGGPIAAH